MKKLLFAIFVVTTIISFTSCRNKKEQDKAKQQVEKVKENVNDAVDKVSDKIEDGADAVKDAWKDASGTAGLHAESRHRFGRGFRAGCFRRFAGRRCIRR